MTSGPLGRLSGRSGFVKISVNSSDGKLQGRDGELSWDAFNVTQLTPSPELAIK